MKVIRTVMEEDYCGSCRSKTMHKFVHLADGSQVVDCFGCGDMTIGKPVAQAVER